MTITTDQLTQFRALLKNEEKSAATLNKYLRDIQRFALWLGDTPLERDAMLDYKADLMRHYAAGSVNSILAALNRFLRMIAREDCRVHRLRIQYQAYSPEEREITAQEYADLVRTARETGRARLALVLQTICATGIRVSELRHITTEALANGRADITLKGKIRTILLSRALQRKLRRYTRKNKITHGAIFSTVGGKSCTRYQIWVQMKRLSAVAHVAKTKIFPHNLRHLFAIQFYQKHRDIVRLADMLGHSSVETTRIYLAASTDECARALDQLGLVI